ncbi:MAG: hypothetical protein Q9160_008198 [Pyrenula sp. 1 TL-2023]
MEMARKCLDAKLMIITSMLREFVTRHKIDFLIDRPVPISTCYNLMEGSHEDAVALSPGPVEYLLSLEVYEGDRHIDSKTFVLTPLEDLGHVINLQPPGQRTDSDSTWIQAQEWLTKCISHHTRCRPSSVSVFYPTRLIQLDETAGDPSLRVVHTQEARIQSPYMTLSHCWGSANFVKLTTLTYQRLTNGFKISDLPNTFHDAIIAAQMLGISYVWIDSLCILQDSREDWRREASAMKDVYKNAVCNVAATGSIDSGGGCFKDRIVSLVQPCILDSGPFGQSGRFILEHLSLWETDVNSAPLNSRAWVMQERLLSRRVLHFGKEQLFWECRELDACETYPVEMPYQFLERANAATKLGLGLDDHEDEKTLHILGVSANRTWRIHAIWADIVTAYRRCNLTKAEDKLIAFSGIAKEVQSMLGNESRYLSGLWSSALLSELMWSVESCEKANGSPSSRPSTYRAPSWSWAAVDGAGSGAVSNLTFPLASAHEAEVTPLIDHDDTGQIIAGHIRLQGCVITVKPYNIHSTTGAIRVTAAIDIGKASGRSDFLVAPDVRSHSLDLELYLLPIYANFMYNQLSISGLVLKRVGAIKTQLYRRFGTFLGWSKSRWTTSDPPSHAEELVQSFASTLDRRGRDVLEAHYKDDKLNEIVRAMFNNVEQRLVEALKMRYSEAKGPEEASTDAGESGRRNSITII